MEEDGKTEPEKTELELKNESKAVKKDKKHSYKKLKHAIKWQGAALRKEDGRSFYHAVDIDGTLVSQELHYLYNVYIGILCEFVWQSMTLYDIVSPCTT